MGMLVKEVREWLDTLEDDDEVAIDDGGLQLVLVDDPEGVYIEVGGIPLDDEEEG